MIYNKIIQIIIIVTLISIYNSGFTQNNIEYFSKADSALITNNNHFSDIKNKIHFGLSAGTNVFVGSHKLVFSQVYTVPYLTYDIDSKLTVNTGFLISNSTFNGNIQGNEPVTFFTREYNPKLCFYRRNL